MQLPLAGRLAALTLGLVLIVVLALALAALGLLGALAEENARSHVQLAAQGAAVAVEREVDDAGIAARLLAERPTLRRLMAEGDSPGLTEFLEQFRDTDRLDGVAVLRGGDVVAMAPGFPWSEVAGRAVPGGGILPPLAGEKAPLALGVAEISPAAGARAVVVRRLDATIARRLELKTGMTVRIVSTHGPVRTREEAGPGAYRSRAAVGDGTVLHVEAEMPASEAIRVVKPLRRTFLEIALGASLFAVALGIWVGLRLTNPIVTLRDAATRIGEGDLVTPVPPGGGGELSELAGAMDGMRHRLHSLTAELREREAEAHALLQGIVEGVIAVDGDRRIRYLNRQAATLLGTTGGESVGRFCGDVLRPVGPDGRRPCEDDCPIVHARARGGSRAVEHLETAGGRRTVVITSAPPTGTTQVQVIRDETEVEAARRSRDAVIANVTHELKTPLSAQLAAIELLRDGLGRMETDAAGRLITALERSTLRLMRLVDNLLESVRIETGRARLQRSPVDLAALVHDVAALTRPLLDHRRQRLDLGQLEEMPLLSADPGQLTQVLVNLLANAHKHAPEGSAIRIGGTSTETHVTLWVEDAGAGVPPALSTSIFDRYHRAETEGPGMGLGLWIAKSIVERHGGRISVSNPPDGGARFTIQIPRSGEIE